MTSLHYALIGLGVVLVGLVMLYNLWQERRSRRQAERLFQADHQDAEVSLGDMDLPDSLPETRIEPCLELAGEETPGPEEWPEPAMADREIPAGVEPARFEPAEFEPAEAVPDVVEPAAPVPAAMAESAAATAPASPLDGEIEYIVQLCHPGPQALQYTALQDGLRRISKPVRWFGRRQDGDWEAVPSHAARPYDRVELGLLLADRAGPVSEVQVDAFCRRLHEFATQHGAEAVCQDKGETLARAQALDAFCAGVDMLIGLNVIPPATGFDNEEVAALAVAAGLVRGADGGFSLRDADGRLLFSLADGTGGEEEPSHGITLLFDVPRVADGLTAFDRMAALGLDLAERLGGQLVDDGGRPASRASLARERQNLEAIYARMAARGIPAGGERALRLFA